MEELRSYEKNRLTVIFTGFLFLYFLSATINAQENCNTIEGLEFICGVNQAEDLLRVPNSNFVIASGRISDTEGQIDAIDKNIKDQVKQSVEFSEKSDYPSPEEAYNDIYVQKDYPFLRE